MSKHVVSFPILRKWAAAALAWFACVASPLMAATPAAAQGTPEPTPFAPTPTPDPLGKSFAFWDVGLLVRYPADWGEPQFAAGQAAISPPGGVTANGELTRSIIALRIVDPVRDFGLPKDAEFGLIALYANLGGPEGRVVPGESGSTTVAGLEAGYINVRDPQRDVIGQSVAFMLPDGRVAVLVGVARTAYWPEFAPLFDQVRGAVRLIKPDLYKTAPLAAAKIAFPAGGIRLALPDGWREEQIGQNARLYFDPALAAYRDDSGFRNGPQLVVRADPLKSGTTPRDALVGVIGDPGRNPITEVKVGGRAAVQHQSIDTQTWQIVTFIGFPSGDGKMFNILRWTVPVMLIEATRPTLQAILDSVEF